MKIKLKMCPSACLVVLLTTLFQLIFQIDCKSYFGIGDRYVGDELLLRDEVQNRHTGLTEVPMISFNYAIREPITYIEIMSEQNVLADVSFSYYNTLINGSVTALSTTVTSENLPFKVVISIYGFKEMSSAFYAAKTLRHQSYNGPLQPQLQPGEVDHMETIDEDDDNEELDQLEDSTEEELDGIDRIEDADKSYDEEEGTFESMDKFITVGYRQKGDYLLYETYQTSPTITEVKTNHSVVFYFNDSAFITHIEFVIIDYFTNKTKEEILNSHLIEYSHFSPSTLKAVLVDHKTTSLFAKMSVYGYRPEDLPPHYVSYVPEKLRSTTETSAYTESPGMHLREQINALQRDGFTKLPSSFDMRRREEELQHKGTTAQGNSSDNAIALISKSTHLSVCLGVVLAMSRLWT